MAHTEKKKVTMTTAYRQNNYLIVDNKPDSVSVTVYFRMSSKQLFKPNIKSKIRSLKNSVHKYDEGQVLIRELTSDTNLLPNKSQLTELSHYLLKYEGLTDLLSFKMLWKRLTDYHTLRHVEKSLLVIQHLLAQKHPFYSRAFEKYCMDRKPEFIKLQNYHFKIDSSDIGQNVRQRATQIYQTLFKPQHISQNVQDIATPLSRTKKAVKPQKHKHQQKKRKKKKHTKKLVNDNKSMDDMKSVEIEDLLSLDSNNFEVTKNNNDPILNNNRNYNTNDDVFDIFGELPSFEQNDNGNEYQDFLSCSTSTSGMIVNNVNNNSNSRDYNFPVTF